MRKIVMIGATLLTIVSCKPPTIKDPMTMFAINTKYFEAGFAPKNLNIRSKEPATVGEWTTEVQFIPLENAPENMMCFSMEDWLKIVKPVLKEGSRFYNDYR